jgi:hypothetical protein
MDVLLSFLLCCGAIANNLLVVYLYNMQSTLDMFWRPGSQSPATEVGTHLMTETVMECMDLQMPLKLIFPSYRSRYMSHDSCDM